MMLKVHVTHNLLSYTPTTSHEILTIHKIYMPRIMNGKDFIIRKMCNTKTVGDMNLFFFSQKLYFLYNNTTQHNTTQSFFSFLFFFVSLDRCFYVETLMLVSTCVNYQNREKLFRCLELREEQACSTDGLGVGPLLPATSV